MATASGSRQPMVLPEIDKLVEMVGDVYASMQTQAGSVVGHTVRGLHRLVGCYSFQEQQLTRDETTIVIYYIKALKLAVNVGEKITDGLWWVRPPGGGRGRPRSLVTKAKLQKLIDAGRVPHIVASATD